MARVFWFVVGTLLVLWVLRGIGVFGQGMAAYYIDRILGLACTLGVPLFFLMLFWAPGFFHELTGGMSHWWRRAATQRQTIEDLKVKVARLDKAHHMAQLGAEYVRHERYRQAAAWLERALEKDGSLLDAKYRLGYCHHALGNYEQAVELLEAVNAEKPDYDYGMAYLRLAQSHQQLGHQERAEELFREMLKFYPGQPEGSYHYAMLCAAKGETEEARRLMQDLILAVRQSPTFQRRRSRHWIIKARWWLWRNGK